MVYEGTARKGPPLCHRRKEATKKGEVPTKMAPQTTTTMTTTHKCRHCNMTYGSRVSLYSHLKTHKWPDPTNRRTRLQVTTNDDDFYVHVCVELHAFMLLYKYSACEHTLCKSFQWLYVCEIYYNPVVSAKLAELLLTWHTLPAIWVHTHTSISNYLGHKA